MRVTVAAFLYFAIVFSTGFALGPIRVLWLEPRIGPLAAAFCEAPLLLAAMVLSARWAPRAVGLPSALKSLALVGLGALALQQAADLAVGLGLRGLGLHDQLAQFATPQGSVYAALLVLFAAMPVLANFQSSPKITPCPAALTVVKGWDRLRG